ncbi:cobyric acid synthase [Fulvimarina pelagi HTCC2506]|uniref:Cobyric acid synthase n=1 Tax=Fulvimarina pelagi HTCC2506 TaxID=314231 RepID=Q0G3F1_9HYPH|nr:hypothetical protein [Fulvimarina pelagi]EAU41880.1 cobyric acid synthase [Fulvimarina pelagi HTCC2506]
MFRKTILSTVAAVVLATSAVSVSATSASAGKRERDIAIAVGIGVLAGVLGAKASQNRGYHPRQNYYKRSGGRHIDSHDDNECFDKPIRKWRYGQKVIVGYRTICR